MNKGIGFALLAALLWGITPIFEKLGLQKVNPLVATTVRTLGIATILLLIMLFSGRLKQLAAVDMASVVYLVIGGVLAGLLGVLAYFMALKHSPSTQVVPIAASYPLVAMVTSIIFLGEELTLSKGVGTLLVVLGIALLH